jgi:hypothetical protein
MQIESKSKIGFYTTFELPSKRGNCNFYGCKRKAVKNGFCEECGKFKIKVGIIDDKP